MNKDSEDGRTDCEKGAPPEDGRRPAYYAAYNAQYELEQKDTERTL